MSNALRQFQRPADSFLPQRDRELVSDGLIEGNTFRGSDKTIMINPEFGWDVCDRLVIRNNTILETGYHQAMTWSEQGELSASALVRAVESCASQVFSPRFSSKTIPSKK